MKTVDNPAAAKANMTLPTDREIRVERIFNASRERGLAGIDRPELLAQWWGRGNKLVIERLEVVRGGHWRFVEHADGETHGFEGRFSEVTPPSRLVQTFEWDGMPGTSCSAPRRSKHSDRRAPGWSAFRSFTPLKTVTACSSPAWKAA